MGGGSDATGQVKASISFNLARERGELFIKRFDVEDLLVTCPDGSTQRNDFFFGTIQVSRKGRFNEGGDYGWRETYVMRVRGKLLSSGDAVGELRLREEFDFQGLCTSGWLQWHASTQRGRMRE